MTDNEIIKALECCKGYLTNDCAICQNVEKYPRCNEFLNEIALDLINRQKAEIESLNIELQSMRSAANSYKMHYETTKSEAIKEFAERLKEKKYKSCEWSHGEHPYVVEECDIDELVKEMTEVNENEMPNMRK